MSLFIHVQAFRRGEILSRYKDQSEVMRWQWWNGHTIFICCNSKWFRHRKLSIIQPMIFSINRFFSKQFFKSKFFISFALFQLFFFETKFCWKVYRSRIHHFHKINWFKCLSNISVITCLFFTCNLSPICLTSICIGFHLLVRYLWITLSHKTIVKAHRGKHFKSVQKKLLQNSSAENLK